MNGATIQGVLAVFQTPFADNGAIDSGALETQFDWLFSNGADGVVLGMVSEVLRLSSEERDQLATTTCKLAGERGAAVISVGAESTHVAIRHARHAQDAGADAVMAAPPHLHPVSDDALLGYFSAIAEATAVPVIVQDASGYVGAPLSIPLQVRLEAELGDRVMFKPEAPPVGPRLGRLLAETAGRARVFEGTGGLYLIDSYRRGVIGTMPAGDLVWALVPLWRALQAGDYEAAYRIGGPLAMLVSLQSSLDNYVLIEKWLLVQQGVFPSRAMREPVGDGVDKECLAEVDRLVKLLRAAVQGG